MAEKNKALTKKQIETLRMKLLAEKQALAVEDELTLSQTDGDEVDQSISDYFNSHLLRFRNRDAFYLKKIDKALKKFERNEYGKCDECDYWIKFERLLARPTAELCIVCKEESERDESSSFIGMQSKSMGKVVDLTGMLA
jgi:DnaK suppressor protein